MNTTTPAVLLVALAATGIPGRSTADSLDTVDVQSRLGVRLDLDLPRRWEVDLEYQHRTVDDLSTYRGSYFTLEADRRLSKKVTALAAWRHSETNEGSADRFAAGLQFENRLGKLRASFRPLLQHHTSFVEDDEVGGEGRTFVRARLRAEYPLTKRLDVYAFVEPFFTFEGDYPIDNWRNGVGLQYEIARWVRVEPYYIYRPDYGKAYNRLFHVVGIDLRFRAKWPR